MEIIKKSVTARVRYFKDRHPFRWLLLPKLSGETAPPADPMRRWWVVGPPLLAAEAWSRLVVGPSQEGPAPSSMTWTRKQLARQACLL